MSDSAVDLQKHLFEGPDWPGFRVFCTTRHGGVSASPYASFNLGDHVGDEAGAVRENRRRLQSLVPAAPNWLQQVHGTDVLDADRDQSGQSISAPNAPQADAAVTRIPGKVLAILTADCLPVVIAAVDASVLAVAHAGWRGLAAGVLENTLERMQVARGVALQAWIGPAIGPRAFEVGNEVRTAFMHAKADASSAFKASGGRDAAGAPRWLADLPALAEQRLRGAGVHKVVHSGQCTVEHVDRFYSYRKEGQTGRFATVAWMLPRG